MVISGSTHKEIFEAMLSFPAGMVYIMCIIYFLIYSFSIIQFINACLLILWKHLSLSLPNQWTLIKRLITLIGVFFIVWCIGATTVALLKIFLKIPPAWLGGVSITLHFIIGIINLILNPSSAPRGKNKVKLWIHIFRGVTAAVIIFIAVMISKLNPTITGLVVSFPAIVGTTIASVYISQGVEVAAGATGPMMVSSVSPGVYAILFGCLLPYLKSIATPIVSFLIAGSCVSTPLAFFIRYLDRRRFKNSVNEFIKINDEILVELDQQEID